ncbi:heavy metal-binding domain-containing protein [bacterium]|nr:heavy metal-binding domain-containing protein [bacterium]
MDLLIVILSLVICFITGNRIEKNHYKNIKEREIKLYKSPCVTFEKNVSNSPKIIQSDLVAESVVIGCDYFKSFLAGLKNLFGGNVSAYESVLDRGRREALLRIREAAVKKHASAVINVKIDTVMLDPIGTKGHPKVCITAYGTAIRYGR